MQVGGTVLPVPTLSGTAARRHAPVDTPWHACRVAVRFAVGFGWRDARDTRVPQWMSSMESTRNLPDRLLALLPPEGEKARHWHDEAARAHRDSWPSTQLSYCS